MDRAIVAGTHTLRRLLPRALSLGIIGLACASGFSCGAGSEVRKVYMALDSTGDRQRNEFYTDSKEFFCDVDYVGAQRNTTVFAVIRRVATLSDSDNINPGPLQVAAKTDDIFAVGEAAPGTTKSVIGFQIGRPKPTDPNAAGSELPFPRGVYDCEIYVNRDPLAKAGSTTDPKLTPNGVTRFAIRWPPGSCPIGFALASSPCAGFWPQQGKQCRGQLMNQVCTCGQASGVWECQ